MAINKVVFGGETLVDLTSDTVTPNTLLAGATAHSANGQEITGAVVTAPIDATLSNEGEAADAKATGDALATKVNAVSGKGLSTEDYTTEEKTKLAGIESGANVTTIDSTLSVTGNAADAKATGDALANKVDKVTGKGLSTNDFTDGLKDKLDGIEAGATKTTIDSTLDSSSTNPVENQAVYNALAGKVDAVTGKGLSTEDYTTTEKTKLAGIENGATNTVVDNALSGSSTNPVQNQVINTALSGKVDKETGKGLSTNDYTTAEKEKVATLESQTWWTISITDSEA